MSELLRKTWDELGLSILGKAPLDVHLLILQRVVRLLAYGQTTIVLASLLHELGSTDFQMGLFMSLTLVGDAVGSLVLTVYADRWGRRKILVIGSCLMACSGMVFATSSSYLLLLLAAMAGVISPSGNEIGPFKAIEESTMATLIPSDQRSTIFAWYALCSGLASSFGSLSGGWTSNYLIKSRGWQNVEAYRFIFWLYTVWAIVKTGLSLILSERCEVQKSSKGETEDSLPLVPSDGRDEGEEADHEAEDNGERGIGSTDSRLGVLGLKVSTRAKVIRLGALFGLDNLAAGLVPLSFIIYFFTIKFDLDGEALGTTFFTTSFVAAMSNLVAASLARRIGNIKTMTFTNLPSAIFLALIPLPKNLWLAKTFLIARFCTAQMDGGPRTAFIASYVSEDERTSVMGIMNVVKTISQSLGPSLTGYLAGSGSFWISFLLAGCMKIAYNLAMLYFFTKVIAKN